MRTVKFFIFICFICIILSTVYWFILPVNIKDENLQIAIKKQLQCNIISRSRLYNITELELSNKQINNLYGLRHLKNINYLDLSYNNIVDLDPINNLKLSYLDLSHNNIDSFNNIKFPNIISLNLSYNKIQRIEHFNEFKKMQDLDLSFNEINNIPLLKLSYLEFLDLSHNKIKSIEKISTLTSLKILFLALNEIEDIYPLKSLTCLEELYLSGNNNIQEPLPLAIMSNLKTLDITDTNLDDIMNRKEIN